MNDTLHNGSDEAMLTVALVAQALAESLCKWVIAKKSVTPRTITCRLSCVRSTVTQCGHMTAPDHWLVTAAIADLSVNYGRNRRLMADLKHWARSETCAQLIERANK